MTTVGTVLARAKGDEVRIMKSKLHISFAILLALAAGISTQAVGQNRRVLSEAHRITGDSFRVAVRTPRGANVISVDQPGAAMLGAIDKGLTDLFAVARRNGYSRKLAYSDYTVYIGRPDREKNADGNYSPDIAIGAAQYAGTDYDKGGYIYVAGMVIWNEPAAFLIAEHKRDVRRVADIVRYEGEHLVLYHNDRRRYSQTADHSKGGGHPILQ
jgi:hypothetical protein